MSRFPCHSISLRCGDSNPDSWIENLPPDTSKQILSYLFLDDLDTLSIASKRIHEIVGEADHLFMDEHARFSSSKLLLQPSYLTETGMRKLLQRYKSLIVLKLYGLAGVGDSLIPILNESPSAQSLHQVSLHGCSLSYWCQTKLTLQHLTDITIMGGSIRVSFESFIASSLNLRSLTIGQCSSLRDEDIEGVTNQLKNTLESLSLHQCLRIKKPILQVEKLIRLNLTGCFSLCDLADFTCPFLKDLDLSFCFSLDGEVIQRVVDSLVAVEHLTLLKCPRLHQLRILSGTLQSIFVSLSTNLHTLSLCCPSLRKLEALSCISLRSFYLDSQHMEELCLNMMPLQNAEVAAPKLRTLKLIGCDELFYASLRCPRLEFVDICGTPLSPNLFRGKVKFLKHGVTSLPTPMF